MDIRNNAAIVIAKNCGRTANVQVKDKATTATFYGPGEVVITNEAGTVLTASTALKSVSAIVIKARRADGLGYQDVTIKGKDIKGYTGRQFLAPQSQVVVIDITEYNKTNFLYTLNFTDDQDFNMQPHRTQVSVEVGGTALTKAQLAAAFVAKINQRFGTGNYHNATFSLFAEVADTDKIKITALDGPFDGLNFSLFYQRFTVRAFDFAATIKDNKTAAITGSVTANRATKGFGHYEEVMQLEKTGRGFSQEDYGRISGMGYDRRPVYDTEVLGKYEADGTTVKRYASVTINWESESGGIVGNHTHAGAIHLFLPVEDAATSQVGVATTGILAVLNKYIVTEYGVGTAFTIS